MDDRTPPLPSVAISYLEDPDDMGQVVATVRTLTARVTAGEVQRPLAGLVQRGQTIVIKPNMVRHFNPAGPLSAVITSPRLVRVLVEIAFDAVGPEGRVVVADSPQNDCDFSALLAGAQWSELVDWAHHRYGSAFEILDMRPEAVTMRDGIVVERRRLPGDPLGEAFIDLGDASAFVESGIDPSRLRGSEYDPSLTHSSHSAGRHAYSVCRTFLQADLLIVVPKVKTHKKVGLSLAMKNLVGIVGEKNCLPHHTAGFPQDGGDEYPDRSLRSVVRQWGVERARTLLASGRFVRPLRAVRKLEQGLLPEVVSRSGNWWGNDTAWRMVVDLVTIVRRHRLEQGLPTLFVYDGLTAGEGNGPLAPTAVPLGLLAVADDPVAGDVAVARELGVEAETIPLLREAVRRQAWRPGDVTGIVPALLSPPRRTSSFRLHPGWEAAGAQGVAG